MAGRRCVCVCLCVCVCVCMCLYKYEYVHIYLYIYILHIYSCTHMVAMAGGCAVRREKESIRNTPLLGTCSRTTPRVFWWSQGGGLFLMREVPLYGRPTRDPTVGPRRFFWRSQGGGLFLMREVPLCGRRTRVGPRRKRRAMSSRRPSRCVPFYRPWLLQTMQRKAPCLSI